MFEVLDNVLYEGGAAGHMMHPYDKFESPDDMLEFFENFLSGKIKGTEKVDGYNLFVGYNAQRKVVAVRNKNEEPMENIEKKFGLNHPAHNGFTAGFAAIREKFQSLTETEEVMFNLWEDGKPKNFINMEILYGYIPNAVPYSQTTNYIVFHHYVGNPDNNWQPIDAQRQDPKLRQLADKLGRIAVVTPNVTFVGDPDSVQRKVKDLQSEWEFAGPIEITKKDVEQRLQKVVQEWRKYPEVQAVIKFANEEDKMDLTQLDPDELEAHQKEKYELMKAATKKIGSAVLTNMVSKLSDTGEVVPGYPGIEGIVTRQGPDLVKITGDFLDYSRPEDTPALDATKKVREFIQKEIFGMTTTTLRGVKSLDQVVDHIMSKKKKKFDYVEDDKLSPQKKEKIRDVIEQSRRDVKDVIYVIQKKGRAFDTKNLLIQTFMLTNLYRLIPSINTYEELMKAYGAQLFGLE
jgi:hypothetical protein